MAVIAGGCAVQVVPLPSQRAPHLAALMPPPPPPPATNGAVMLVWNPGIPIFTTVSNITESRVEGAGEFNFFMVRGLEVGSTNTFIAFNEENGEFGFSNTATGVAEPYVPIAKIEVFTYLITLPVAVTGVTSIVTSTNLSAWYKVEDVTNAGPTHSLIWTNDGVVSRFFRSVR